MGFFQPIHPERAFEGFMLTRDGESVEVVVDVDLRRGHQMGLGDPALRVLGQLAAHRRRRRDIASDLGMSPSSVGRQIRILRDFFEESRLETIAQKGREEGFVRVRGLY